MKFKMASKSYRICAVPLCPNTTIKCPSKLFIHVPQSQNLRVKWLQLARRDPTSISPKSTIYFCEDHFDLPKDMENYMEYNVMGSVSTVRMKPSCIPSRFECQPDRLKRTAKSVPRSVAVKRQRASIIQDILAQTENKTVDTPSTSNIESQHRVDYCFVPMCPSNSTKFPNKFFITGPSDPYLRRNWFLAARCQEYSSKTVIRCCEDHFDLENDLENWIKFKLMGGKLILKKGVLPHYFACQNRKMPLKDTTKPLKSTMMPLKDTTMLLTDTMMPLKDTITPSKDTMMPLKGTIIPLTIMPLKDTMMPLKGTIIPLTMMPLKDTITSLKDTMMSLKNTMMPLTDTMMPLKDTMMPLKDTIMPLKDTKMPLKETMMPLKETMMPLKDTIMPLKDTIMPLKDTIMPLTDTLMPLKYTIKPLKHIPLILKRKKREILKSTDMTDPVIVCSPVAKTYDSQNIKIFTEKSLQSTETQKHQTCRTNKRSRTKNNNKSTVTSARCNKQSAAPITDKLSGTDNIIPEVTEGSRSSETNNTSSCTTELSDTNKRRKKRTANDKLPEAEELIVSVYKFLQAEYEFLKDYIGDICDLSPLTNVLKRTADACGVRECTVTHVVRKTRPRHDLNEAGLFNSLSEGESSCGDSEIEEQDEKFMIDDSSILEEESYTTDSVDEPEDNIEQADYDSEEREECEIEAPNMDIDYYEVKPLDPLKTEPVDIKTEFTDLNPYSITKGNSRCDISDIEQDDLKLTGYVSEERVQFDCEEAVEVKTESTDVLYLQSVYNEAAQSS